MKSVREITREIYFQELGEAYYVGFHDGMHEYKIKKNDSIKTCYTNFKVPKKSLSLHPETVETTLSEWTNLHLVCGFLMGLVLILATLVLFASRAHAASTTPPTLTPSSGTDANFVVQFNSPTDIVYAFDCHDDYIQTLSDSPQNISYTDSDCTHIGNKYKFLAAPADNLADSYCHTDLQTCKDFLATAEYDYSQTDYNVFLELPNAPTYLDWLLVSMWVIFLLTLIAGRMFFPPLANKV